MDEKVSRDSFKAYRDWQRYILRTKPKLSKGCKRTTLLAYCFAMASHGTNGLGCYAGDATIAKELGMYDGKSVGLLTYMRFSIRLSHPEGMVRSTGALTT